MQTQTSSPVLSLKQYTKDVPPGWRPRSYPIKDYKEALGVWSRLTRLEDNQIGAAMISRLEGGALRIAHSLTITRPNIQTGQNETHKGIDAVSLAKQDAIMDPHTGAEIAPSYPSGAKVLLDRLMELFFLDDQDLAWTSLDRFFQFTRPHDMDFANYVVEWDRLFQEAEHHGGLVLGDTGKCWLFWSRSNLPERQLADLRLKVNGDLSRYRDMIRLQLKISKNEQAADEQHHGYKNIHYEDITSQEDPYDMSREDDDGWWYTHDDYYGEDYYGDSWQYDNLDDWYQDDWYDHEEWYPEPSPEPTQPSQDATSESEDFYGKKGKKGKGKGGKRPAGDQCTQCGSKWHSTENCPMNATSASDPGDAGHAKKVSFADEEYYDDYYEDNAADDYEDYYGFRRKGKGRSKKGKSKSKPRFGKSWFPSFGFNGRKGKFRGKKGKGKRKGPGKGKGYGTHMTFANFPTSTTSDSPQEEPAGLVATFASADDDHISRDHRSNAFESLFGNVSPIRSPTTDYVAEVPPTSSSSDAPAQINIATSLLDSVTFVSLGDELPQLPATSTLNHSAIIEPTDNLAQPSHAHHPADMLTELAHSCNWCFRHGDTQCTLCHKHFCSDHGLSQLTATSSTSTTITPFCFLCRSISQSALQFDDYAHHPDHHDTDKENSPDRETPRDDRLALSLQHAVSPPPQSSVSPDSWSTIHTSQLYTGTLSTAHTPSETSWTQVPQIPDCALCPTTAIGLCSICGTPACQLHSRSFATSFFCEDCYQDAGPSTLPANTIGNFILRNVYGAMPSANGFQNFTCVNGKPRPGLIVDPGAARGLIGSDSLRDIINTVLRPAGKDHLVKWKQSNNKFTGISTDEQHSIGLVNFPIGLLGINNATYTADVIGGASSRCPGLVPLVTLLAQGCVISCGYFANKDGIMGIRSHNGFCAQRLHLTDSGHYLLPIDNFHRQRQIGLDRCISTDHRQLSRAAHRQLGKDRTSTPSSVTLLTTLATTTAEEDHLENFQ